MDISPDGILTLLMVVLGACALGGALFYGMRQHRPRDDRRMEHAGKQPDA